VVQDGADTVSLARKAAEAKEETSSKRRQLIDWRTVPFHVVIATFPPSLPFEQTRPTRRHYKEVTEKPRFTKEHKTGKKKQGYVSSQFDV
jgi:hypothetical protein